MASTTASSGSMRHYRDHMLHRDDGPAVVWPDGAETWCQYGRKHRDGGPAVTNSNGSQEWWHCGQLHRADGPAVVYKDGSTVWYLENNWIKSTKEYQRLAGLTDEQMSVLILKYGNICDDIKIR